MEVGKDVMLWMGVSFEDETVLGRISWTASRVSSWVHRALMVGPMFGLESPESGSSMVKLRTDGSEVWLFLCCWRFFFR